MPMMQAIRGRAGSIIVKILFGLLIVSFGFWGIYTRSDYFGGSHSPDTVIATVGDNSIRAQALEQTLEPTLQRLRAQLGPSFDRQQAKQLGLVDNLLHQLIDRSLLDQETARLGLDVSDDTIRAAIYANPAFRAPNGQFDRQRFAQLLAMNRMSEDQLVARLRRDIPRGEMLQAITAGATAPRPVIETLYRYRNEKRVADIVEVPAASVSGVGTPSDADLEKFYKANPDLFRAPEFRALTVASLSPADVQDSAEIPEDKLRQQYDQHKDEFATPEQREIQQLLAPSEDKAKQAEAEIAAGKDWTAVAKELGQDPDTVDLGLLNRQEIPHELGDVAFELPPDKASEPVKSPAGWHILRVVKIEPATTQSFAEAKPKIEKALKLREATDRLDKVANQADDALAGGANLAEVAGKFGLTATPIAAVDDSGHDPDGKPVQLPVAPDQVLKAAFATKEGDTSRIIDTDNGAIFAVHVDKVTPPQVRPLADVKDKAIAAWQADEKQQKAAKEAADLKAAVTPDVTLAKAAGDKGLTLLAAVPMSRHPAPGQKVPPALVAKLFAAKPGDVVTADAETGAYVAQLKEVQSPETVPEAEAKQLETQLAEQQKAEIAGAFTEALRKRYPVEIKRDALDRMF
ncbi:MAG: peptidyl-prolyl cis-trans isomerase [Thiohalocapsa sp.]